MAAVGALLAVPLALPLWPAAARADGWLDDRLLCPTPGVLCFPRAHREESPPIQPNRSVVDTDAYALRHGFDVKAMDRDAFVSLHKNGLFDYQPDAMLYIAPPGGAHGALSPMAEWLHPDYALYGYRSQVDSGFTGQGPLAPGENALRGVTPRVLDLERPMPSSRLR